MSQKLNSEIAVIGIDIGKNSFHLVGQDRRGALVLRQGGPFSAVPRSARFARNGPGLDHRRSRTRPHYMARVADGSIRTATVADAPAIGFVHVEAWRETYVGIVPDHVLADLSVDRRAAMWGRILSDPSAPDANAAFVAERGGTIVGFGCCGLQRDEMLSARGYGGEINVIYILRSSQHRGFGLALMSAMAQELRRRQLEAASLWVLQENASARRFYEGLGGEVIGEKEDTRDQCIFVEVAYGWCNLAELAERTVSP